MLLVTCRGHTIGHIALRSECAGQDIGRGRRSCRRFVPWAPQITHWLVDRLSAWRDGQSRSQAPGSPAWRIETTLPFALVRPTSEHAGSRAQCGRAARPAERQRPGPLRVSPARGVPAARPRPHGTPSIVLMNIPEMRPDDVRTDEARAKEALQLLSDVPVGLDVAVKGLSRGSGVYAWWAAPSVFPDLPGLPNGNVPSLRMLYLGRATSLRGRILRNHLRRSGNSTLRRTLAGLLASEGYRTTWTDRVVLVPQDEARLTAWMYAHLRLTWAEDAEPATIEAELVRRLHPPLNVHGVDPEHVQAAVVAAKNAYNTSSRPAELAT
jgi:hypothetical protein